MVWGWAKTKCLSLVCGYVVTFSSWSCHLSSHESSNLNLAGKDYKMQEEENVTNTKLFMFLWGIFYSNQNEEVNIWLISFFNNLQDWDKLVFLIRSFLITNLNSRNMAIVAHIIRFFRICRKTCKKSTSFFILLVMTIIYFISWNYN